MFWLRLVYIFLAMGICLVGGGITLARRMIDEPKLAMVSAVGIGGIVLYLLAAGIYVTGISWDFSYAITTACAIALVCERKEIIRWWRDPECRQLLIGWILIELWILLVNLNLRHFAMWVGDWEEHFNRAKFFLERWPVWSNIFGGYYILPSRPPMMNIIESLFMAQTGPLFANYQFISGFLNATLYLSIAGLAMHWNNKARLACVVAALLALNPWFMQNATFTWTKLYSEFYVILGVWLYLKRFRGLAMVMMTGGCLVHYAVVVVPVFIAIYDLIFHFREWRRILAAWLASAALMATWVVWGVVHYGHSFFSNTTTVTSVEGHSRVDLIRNFLWNTRHSLVPSGFDPTVISNALHSNLHPEVTIRDWLFLMYQPGLILCCGFGGLAALAWSLMHARRQRMGFWISFIVFICVGGLLLHTPPGYQYGGVAHVVLQPIAWLAMAWIASKACDMPWLTLRLWCSGVLIDALWLLLHFYLESRPLAFIKHGSSYSPVDPAAGSFLTLGNVLTQILRKLWFIGMKTIRFDTLLITAMIAVAAAWWVSLFVNLNRIHRSRGVFAKGNR